MGEWIGKDRKARRCYGFDEIALVPGAVTINPEEVDIAWEVSGKKFSIPFLASAMDGGVDPKFAVAMGKLGGLAVLNLEGIYTRYEDYFPILDDIAKSTPEKATELVQKLYTQPIKEKLISKRIQEIKEAKVPGIAASEAQFVTSEGWGVFFDVNRSVASQLSNLSLLLSRQIPAKDRNRLAYIDLKLPKWAYYCFKNTPCSSVSKPTEEEIKP